LLYRALQYLPCHCCCAHSCRKFLLVVDKRCTAPAQYASLHTALHTYNRCVCGGAALSGRSVILRLPIRGRVQSAECKCMCHCSSPSHCSTAAALPLTHRLDVLQWLHTDLQCPWEARFIIRIAAEKGMLPLLQWMLQQRDGAAVDNAYVTCAAAVGGHLPTIIWLHRAQRLHPDNLCTRVAYHNHILVMLWLHQQG
jgi:hypothetical protein